MNIEEIKDSLLNNNFIGLRVKLDTVIEFIDEQQAEIEALKVKNQALKIMNDGKNKIIEEYEHKYPDFFFMENDLMGKR